MVACRISEIEWIEICMVHVIAMALKMRLPQMCCKVHISGTTMYKKGQKLYISSWYIFIYTQLLQWGLLVELTSNNPKLNQRNGNKKLQAKEQLFKYSTSKLKWMPRIKNNICLWLHLHPLFPDIYWYRPDSLQHNCHGNQAMCHWNSSWAQATSTTTRLVLDMWWWGVKLP